MWAEAPYELKFSVLVTLQICLQSGKRGSFCLLAMTSTVKPPSTREHLPIPMQKT